MKTLELTNSDKLLLLDDEDYERVSQYGWYIIQTKKGRICGIAHWFTPSYTAMIASFIMNQPNVKYDHIDRNPLNNQKSNLRGCSRSQNSMNSTKRSNTSSKYKGVAYYKAALKTGSPLVWEAYLNRLGRRFYLGRYATEEEAARAYNAKASVVFGEFANLNKV